MRGRGTIFAMQYTIGSHQTLVPRNHGVQLIRMRMASGSSSDRPEGKTPAETAIGLYHKLTEVGRNLGQSVMQRIAATAQNWWNRYEEFVGLNEVREAQGNVTEAEKVFMVARGIVREARENLEAQQMKLKEIRDRLDRVSREDIQYLELATLEHRLLQEEKRLRGAYGSAEDAEREKFSLFSAAVRESHEKERTRAEKTKNWSIIGSILGALIGVAGSTYVNRVRLQELKALLLEAQKGPASLQEAIREQAFSHHSQQKDLNDLITDLRGLLHVGAGVVPEAQAGVSPARESPASPRDTDSLSTTLKEQLSYSKQAHSCLESLRDQLSDLEKNFSQMAAEVQLVKAAAHSPLLEPAGRAVLASSLEEKGVILELSDMERRLEAQVNRNSVYSTLLTCTVFAATLPVLYVLFRAG
ncbi:mitochondrial potassium channel [Ornithorhynchus anatinus]|uniref:Coiled-coil domain containing 51 n=1 Tax=Ornithorhynchus anatinus TaxID=9258 RepID=A0A6I8PAB5_ORNAN|nr:mitochondrial potassium channel [Ornithorhynchus anatinus]XP_028907299.1 mitochondrial potassium channel [Ornithorhynchus anatinus]